jgi:phage-related protein
VADFIAFNEGRIEVEDIGWPATVSFDLSTNAVANFTAASTFGGGYAVVTGTGYTNKTQSQPVPTAATLGQLIFTLMSWATVAAVNWTSPKTIVALDAGTSKLICAWNLVAGGAARDMSQANTTLNVTPTYAPSNPP